MIRNNWRLSLPSLVILLTTSACSFAGPPVAGNVTLKQNGADVILANGEIAATINTASARVTSIQFRGHEMVSYDRQVYFSFNGGDTYEQPSRCDYSITKQENDLVDISCKRIYDPKDKVAFDIDVHYALRSGDTALYVYATLEHKPEYPEAGMGEWRTVWFMPHDKQGYPLLEKVCVDSLRNWTYPAPDSKGETQGIKEVTKFTSGPWAGKMDSKYVYSGEYSLLRTWGFASDKNHLGDWFVTGGLDFFNDGPTKQDLTVSNGNLLVHLNMNHYDGGGVKIVQGQSWRKFYGPWLMLMTNEPTAEANWAAAKKRVEIEQAQWPYKWISDPDYAADQRGSATGKLIVRDPLKPKVSGANAWVGLAQSEQKTGTNWQFQADAYQYWARTDGQGNFKIPTVRPGTYTLYAFTEGAVGEYSKEDVTVTANTNTAVETVTWNVQHHGSKIAWEIGTPDRTAAEFRHGHTDYWYPYLFDKFADEFSNPLVYDVSRNNYAQVLNYAQGSYRGEPWTWKINFNLKEVPRGDATLTLAFAGSNAAKIDVHVNADTAAKPLETVDPPNQGGNALLRQGVHAKYGVSYVTIPARLLHAGTNSISLTQTQTKSSASHVMYDYLNLELP